MVRFLYDISLSFDENYWAGLEHVPCKVMRKSLKGPICNDKGTEIYMQSVSFIAKS